MSVARQDLLPAASVRTDWLLIGLAIALVLPLRLWLLHNTEVTARDSIGYIRYALQFEQYTWKEVLLKNHQHPGYPLLVLAMSQPIRAMDGATTPDNMELSAQLVNFFASLILIVPMYWLCRLFFDRQISFFAALLYQYLPISAQHLSDGISEPAYLVLLVTGLLQAVQAIRERSVWRCQLCGLFTGLAYLTRPEGALILPAFAIVLIVAQIRPFTRCSWQRFFECGTATVTTAALVGAIYVSATGKFSNKPTVNVITQQDEATLTSTPGDRGWLFAASFPISEKQPVRTYLSIKSLVLEVNQGFHYVVTLPAVLGLIWSFASLRQRIEFWMLAVYAMLHATVLLALAMTASYVSDRHVMILVLIGTYFAVFGLRELPQRTLQWFGPTSWHRAAPACYVLLMVAVFACCLPKATQRIHGNRVGNHEAGLWLSGQIGANDLVIDDHSWSHFFSGLVFREGREGAYPEDFPSKCYVVTTRGRERTIETEIAKGVITPDATVAFVWPADADPRRASVVVHVQQRRFATHPWRRAVPEK